jgi:glutamate-1-semialdehyde 2,1-aminomutase
VNDDHLIFDEVITGFRLAPGGAQEFYGVLPDVSTYGKVAGGGLPCGAVGGTAEAMRLMEYDVEPGSILVAGTFNGNSLVTATGTAVLRRLRCEPQLYPRLNALGDRFRAEINRFAQEGDYPAIATGIGSCFGCTRRADRSTASGMRARATDSLVQA